MNARNCQLCGKPLSRLRVGGDGDFCSKEHRNQFRLRAGMDRLVEVNKVASLMRRRESARHIPVATLMCRGVTTRHDFGDLIPTDVTGAPRMIALQTAEATRPRIAPTNERCVEAVPAPATGVLPERRAMESGIAIVPSGTAPRMKDRRQNLAAALVLLRQEIHGFRCGAADVNGETREFRQLPPADIRTHFGEGPAMLRRGGRVWTGSKAAAQPMRTAASVGNALRVSIGLGFQVPPAIQSQRRIAPRVACRLPVVEKTQAIRGGERDLAAATRELAMAIPEIAARLPRGPASGVRGEFPRCAVMSANGGMLRNIPADGARISDLRWAVLEPRLRAAGITQSLSGFARRNGSKLFAVAVSPKVTPAAPQLTAEPFPVREELCVPAVPYCNVLAAAATPEPAADEEPLASPPVHAPVLVAAVAAVKYEEHFDSGWDNWVGGVADWKVDVAGVRTGSLALYMPTLEFNDYDLEFLARIDTRSVNWVVRAAGAEAHILCTVTAMEGGQLQFSRALVQRGAAEAAVISETRVPGRPRATFTVRMSVAGPVFSITIDGKTIDTWVDDRLATGGIGFVGAPDDRARLYWVRVSSPAAPSKEYVQ